MAVQLRLRICIFSLGEEVRPLRQELKRQGRATIDFPRSLRHGTDHVRIAVAHGAKRAGNRRGADFLQCVDQLFGRSRNVGRVRHFRLR